MSKNNYHKKLVDLRCISDWGELLESPTIKKKIKKQISKRTRMKNKTELKEAV